MATETTQPTEMAAVNLAVSPDYEQRVVLQIMLHRKGMQEWWGKFAGEEFTYDGLMAQVRCSMPGEDAEEVQLFKGDQCMARCQGGDEPWIEPLTKGPADTSWKKGRMLRGADLLAIVAKMMKVELQPVATTQAPPKAAAKEVLTPCQQLRADLFTLMERWARKNQGVVPIGSKQYGIVKGIEAEARTKVLAMVSACNLSIAKSNASDVWVKYGVQLVAPNDWTTKWTEDADAKAKHTSIKPTAAAKKELPAEQLQVSREAVATEIRGHVGAWRDWLDLAEKPVSRKVKMGRFKFAEEAKALADGMFAEVEAIASKPDVEWMLQELMRTCAYTPPGHTWAPLQQPLAHEPARAVTKAALAKAAPGGVVGRTGVGPIILDSGHTIGDIFKQDAARMAKRKHGHQAGDVLPDGTMVADPTNALLELHDRENAPAKRAPERIEPPPPKPVAHTLSELAGTLGSDRRQREVIKKRFTTLLHKLQHLSPVERTAFIAHINTLWP